MRRTGKQKLRGQRGASLLLALLFTLAAAMVSMVIISASGTAYKRMYDDTQRQQEYLTLESAAKVFKNALEHTTYTVTAVPRDGDVTDYQYADGSGLLAEAVYQAIMSSTLPNGNASFTLPSPSLNNPEQWELSPSQDIVPKVVLEITKMTRETKEDFNLEGFLFKLEATIHLSDKNLDNPETQKLFLVAESTVVIAAEGEEYGFSNVELKTRLNDAVS